MDKFGIFKLLNSFLTNNGENQTAFSTKTEGAKTDFLSSLSSLFSNTKKPDQPLENSQGQQPATTQPLSTKKPVANPPLQRSMLSIMSSHDKFLERVKKNQNKPD